MKSIVDKFINYFDTSGDEEYWVSQALNGDTKRRKQALQRLSSLTALERIIDTSTNQDDVTQAKQRWATIVIHQVDIGEFEAEQTVLSCTDEERLSYLANQTENSNVGFLAFHGLSSESVLLDLIRKANNSNLYPAIIAKLQSKSALETALAYLTEITSEPKFARLIERKIAQLSVR